MLSCKNEVSVDDTAESKINISQLINVEEEVRLLSDFASDIEYFIPEATEDSYFQLMGINYIGPELVILHDKKTRQFSCKLD